MQTSTVSFEKINKALLWLKNNNKINDYQLNVLQEYYKNNDNTNVEVLRDELFKLGTNPSFVNEKISEIENNRIDVIDVDDFASLNNDYKNDSVSNFNNNINSRFNNDYKNNENFVQKELFMLKGEYPNSIISLTDIPHRYILSQDGKDQYVNVEGSNGIYRIVKVVPNNINESNQSEERGISLTKYTPAGKAFADKDNKQAAFTNILFFIFLSGLSVGVVFMVILNFFMK